MPTFNRAEGHELSTFDVDGLCMTSGLQLIDRYFATGEFIVWPFIAEPRIKMFFSIARRQI